MEKIDNFGLTTSQVQERIDNGQVNVSHDNISKTKKQIVMEHTLTYFNILNVFLAGIILSTGRWTNLTFMVVVIVNAVVGKMCIRDSYKTTLQELIQADQRRTVTYELLETSGPSNAPEFTVAVMMDDMRLGIGKGTSKKRADQQAANDALNKIATNN